MHRNCLNERAKALLEEQRSLCQNAEDVVAQADTSFAAAASSETDRSLREHDTKLILAHVAAARRLAASHFAPAALSACAPPLAT